MKRKADRGPYALYVSREQRFNAYFSFIFKIKKVFFLKMGDLKQISLRSQKLAVPLDLFRAPKGSAALRLITTALSTCTDQRQA